MSPSRAVVSLLFYAALLGVSLACWWAIWRLFRWLIT